MIIIHTPLQTIRGILILGCGVFLLVGGIFALTGHGLDLPFFYRLGGTSVSLMGSIYITVVGFAFTLIGTAELLDRSPNFLYRKELREVLKDIAERSNSYPDEKEAAQNLLDVINRHSTSQEIKHARR